MSLWFDVNVCTPKDDQNIFVINTKLSEIPMLAYYDEEIGEYLSLLELRTYPLSITHWMPMPEGPTE